MNTHKKPMSLHRPRSNGVSIKMRLAASKNVRTRYKDGIKITMPRAPWDDEGKKEKNDERIS